MFDLLRWILIWEIWQHLNIEPEEENDAFLTFVIPRDREDLLTVSSSRFLSIFNIVLLSEDFYFEKSIVPKSIPTMHSWDNI